MKIVTTFISVVLLISLPTLASAQEFYDFTWDTLLLAWMKLDPTFDYHAHVEAYMRIYRPKLWEQVRNNEFQLKEREKETILLMKTRVAHFSLNREMVLHGFLELGKYDFASKSFPVENMSETHYWYQYRWAERPLPSRFQVFLSNPGLLASIPMEKDAAGQFLQRRTDSFGNIDRKIPATIRLRIIQRKDSPGELLGEIQSATVYSNSNRQEVILRVKKAKSFKNQ